MSKLSLVSTLMSITVATSAVAQTPVGPVRTAAVGQEMRPFFDSLAALRPMPFEQMSLAPDTIGAVAWLDLLQDSVLVDLVREAVRSNRDMHLAQARIREFRAAVGVSKADLYPQLSANGTIGQSQVVFGSIGALGFETYRATGDLTWELDFWGRIRSNARGASLDLAAEREESRATILSLVSDVASAYLQLRELDENLAITERTLVSRRETLELARRRLAEGVISELDVLLFEAEVAAPAARVAEFTRSIARTEHQLSLLIGRVPGSIARGRPLAAVARAVTVPEEVSADLISRRPDVMGAAFDLDAAHARTGAARKARLPTIFLNGQYGTQAENFSDMFKSNTEIFTAQAGISIPLFTGGRLKNQQEVAAARAEQAEIRYERAVLTAMREVSDAMIGVRTSRDQIAAQETQTQALRRAFTLAERRYDAGIASYLEVLDAQRSLFNAELALTSAEREYLVSAVTLYKALGGSWE